MVLTFASGLPGSTLHFHAAASAEVYLADGKRSAQPLQTFSQRNQMFVSCLS
jgi:hypothetical protein